MGYAFIIFMDVNECQHIEELFVGVECRVCMLGFSRTKVCRVSQALVQGLEGDICHLRGFSIVRLSVSRVPGKLACRCQDGVHGECHRRCWRRDSDEDACLLSA